MHRGLLAVVLSLWSADAQAAVDCAAQFWFIIGQTTNGTMTAPSGASCSTQVEMTTGKIVIRSLKISTQPKNGTVSAQVNGVTYRSKPGFKGGDYFAFAITGTGDAGDGTAIVQIRVSVR